MSFVLCNIFCDQLITWAWWQKKTTFFTKHSTAVSQLFDVKLFIGPKI